MTRPNPQPMPRWVKAFVVVAGVIAIAVAGHLIAMHALGIHPGHD